MGELGNDPKNLVFASYAKLLQGGRYHGTLQTKYRVMCSTWLLASFAAIGFLLSQDNLLPFDPLIGVSLISLIGIIGIYILWYADTFVEELLLDINVVEGLRLEMENPWMPQVHHTFLHLYKNTNARIVKVLFFIGCKSILLVSGSISLFLYFYSRSFIGLVATVVGFMVLNFLSSHLMIAKAGKIQEFMDFLWRVDERR